MAFSGVLSRYMRRGGPEGAPQRVEQTQVVRTDAMTQVQGARGLPPQTGERTFLRFALGPNGIASPSTREVVTLPDVPGAVVFKLNRPAQNRPTDNAVLNTSAEPTSSYDDSHSIRTRHSKVGRLALAAGVGATAFALAACGPKTNTTPYIPIQGDRQNEVQNTNAGHVPVELPGPHQDTPKPGFDMGAAQSRLERAREADKSAGMQYNVDKNKGGS